MSKKPIRSIFILALIGSAFLLLSRAFGIHSIARRIFSPTPDTTGGTCLIYEIDTQGFTEEQKKDLSTKMIRILRHRLDPDNLYNLVWLPHGSTRIELQIPLPGPKVRQKWLDYEKARTELSSAHIEFDDIIFTLIKRKKERAKDFKKIADDSVEKLKVLNNLGTAFDKYLPFAGVYDPNENKYDPDSFQQMLSGTGKLEFRVLPTKGHPNVDMTAINGYIERLEENGPELASDDPYVWCEIKNIDDWNVIDREQRPSIIGTYNGKSYVLASNKINEAMLHNVNTMTWQLEKAFFTTDQIGRRAIGFLLDDKGGALFANMTGKNIERPLCILLDGKAISAPNINDRIYKQGVITGSFAQTEVADMVNRLNAGCLPARLVEPPILVKTIERNVSLEDNHQNVTADNNLPTK